MFKATLSDPNLLKDSVDTIAQLVSEGNFKLKQDGIHLMATDRATVAVVNFKLDKKSFEEYSTDKDYSIGLNIENLLQILRRAKSKDKIILEVGEEEKLKIKIQGKYPRNFSLPLIDISEGEVPPINELDFPSKVQLKSSFLEEGINDADIVSDYVAMRINPQGFYMESKGDASNTRMELDKDLISELKSQEEVKATYSLDYLKKIIKASKISDIVKIELGNDYPMRIDFNQPEKVSMSFILAPRVEES